MYHTEDMVEIYRVNERSRWYRRKWQVEWEGCRWAHRGYTRIGCLLFAYLRIDFPLLDKVYVRIRRMIRRNITRRSSYKGYCNIFGKKI